MRLLTRSDYDGLVCGSLLLHLGIVDEWKFVHPKDMQDALLEVNANDVVCNAPYVEGCGMWFDHHISEGIRLKKTIKVAGLRDIAPSCARNVYNYYKSDHDLTAFTEMVEAVDKVDSADLTVEDIENSADWVLLGFLMDPRTGLGRFHSFTISNYRLMEILMHKCGELPVKEILNLPDVRERIEVYNEQNAAFKEMLKRCSRTEGNLIISDLRSEEVIYSGNRFMIYSMYPKQNVSIKLKG